MNWTDIARQVIGLGAPVLGGALGGPLGEAAGKILASVLGAPAATPEAINAVLAGAGTSQIASAETQWIAVLQAEAETARAAIAETQATIRAELASDNPLQRWWRPIYAIELTLECAALWLTLIHGFWLGDLAATNALIGGTALFVAYWGFRFGVLGVYVNGRTREKLAGTTVVTTGGAIGKAVGRLIGGS